MISTREILEESLREYLELAQDAYGKRKYNGATTLFFKAIVAACDLFLLMKEGLVPSSHSERFRLLEKYPELYRIADRDFPFYQDSYTKRMDKGSTDVLRQDAGTIERYIKKVQEKQKPL
jgi:hypothetical protein